MRSTGAPPRRLPGLSARARRHQLPSGLALLARRGRHPGLAALGPHGARRAGGDLDRPPAVDVYGGLLGGTRADASELVEEQVGRVGSDAISAALTPMTYPQTCKFWAELGDADAMATPAEEVWLYSRSELFGRPLPGEAVASATC